MPSIEKSVRVTRTALGRGVFAQRRFRRNQIVGEVQGTVIADSEYGSEYCMDLGNGASLEPRAPFRYLNHSCDPNCQLFVWEDADQDSQLANRMWVQALRPIQPGEELTIDYAWTADSAIPCLCQSDNCRGWIVHPDELPLVATIAPVAETL